MGYRFTGFLVRPTLPPPAALAPGAAWRAIGTPFAGAGLRVGGWSGRRPDLAGARRLLAGAGLGGTSHWLFIDYSTWGGPVEYVYGLGVAGGREFGPVHESDGAKAREAFVGLMAAFGVAPADALDFAPFERGFWGDT